MLVDIIPNIYTYSMIFSFIIYILYFIFNLRNKTVPIWHLVLSSIFIILVSILGGRIMWAIENISYANLSDIFSLKFGNWRLVGVFIANLISVFIVTFVYYKYYKLPISTTLSVFLEAVFLEFSLNKLACFFGGCCYGIETTLPWGMVFDDDILRHPTQLYEFISFLTIFILVRLLRDKLDIYKRFSFATILYIIMRIIVEPLREESAVYLQGPTRPIYYILLLVCTLVIFKDKLLGLYQSKLKNVK